MKLKAEEQAEILKGVEDIIKRREAREERKNMDAPLVKADVLKKNRTPPGAGRSVTFGVPIDIFDLEELVLRVSPTDLKTILNFNSSRIIEQMRNSERISADKKEPFSWSIILWIIIIIAIAGGVLIFLPRIMGALGGLFGG